MKLSNPKPFTIKGPKVVIPPLGILSVVSNETMQWKRRSHEMEKIKANQNQVLMSSKLSVTCSHFHTVETTPI